MRRVFYYFILASALTGFGFGSAEAQLKVLEGNDISFGTVYQTGAMVQEKITLQNIGSDTITINKVTTSCGCTAASPSRDVLAPGEKADVNIQFNPTGYIGDVTKYIHILNSYQKDQLVTVKMTGRVAYALQPTPGYILFNNARVGKLDSTEISLSNTTDSPMTITGVDVPSNEITYKLSKKTLKPGEFANLDLYIKATNSRDVDGYVVVHTTSDKQPQLQIRVFAGLIGN